MHVARLALVLTLGALATGCDGRSNPATPSPPAAPTVTGLAISGIDAALTGVSTMYTATATLSDGTTRAVTPTWTSSNTDVATVDNAGRLDARAHGATTLTATHDGISATKSVQVVNNYRGAWTGRSAIRSCDESGIYEDGVFGGIYTDVPWCQVADLVGSERSITLLLSQSGSAQSEISGTLSWGDESGPVTGAVADDGRLNLRGSVDLLDWDGKVVVERLHILSWDTRLSSPGVMVGRWALNRVSAGAPGNVYTELEFVSMIQN